MSTKTLKYRPVLTAVQITHILNLAKTESPAISSASISLIATLSPFLAKIESAGIVPAYETMQEKSVKKEPTVPAVPKDPIEKEHYWEQCFSKFLADPTSCSLKEIEAAQEHRYLNGLMSLEEQKEFEAPAFDPIKEGDL